MRDPKLSAERLWLAPAPRGGNSSSTNGTRVSVCRNKIGVHELVRGANRRNSNGEIDMERQQNRQKRDYDGIDNGFKIRKGRHIIT